MKIFNAQQLGHIDQQTIKNEPITSIDLMERAADQCHQWIVNQDIVDQEIHVFCGMGNNGGDGLAIARFLHLEEYMTGTYVVHFSDSMSEEFVTNYKRAEEAGIYPEGIHSEDDFPIISKDNIVIDAIFGIGLNKEPRGFTKQLIEHINASGATVYSIDVPSGLFIDRVVKDKDTVIKADKTLTFQTPKLAFLLPDNRDFLKDFILLNIGLDRESLKTISSNYYFITNSDIQTIYKEREKYSHKGSYGHSLLIGGSFGKIGAVVLASKAALKVGSGLVTAYVPKCGYSILQTSIPEVMVEVDAENEIEFINYKITPTVIGVGMGMGTSDKTTKALGEFLKQNKLPLVIDADGLNIISKNKKYLDFLPENTILTPHPKELERLIGTWKNDYDKLDKIKEFSTRYKCIVVLKGAHTVIVQKDRYYFNSTGNPALATAGTGDVLTGIITGFIAQNYTPLEASIIGVFLHGRTADISEMITTNFESFIASDILKLLPDAFSSLKEITDEEMNSLDNYNKSDDDYFFDDDFEAPF